MRDNLHRFFRAARGAGVHVSPAESIDAMRAVSRIGFDERSILRDTLLLTLAKSEDEKKALGACFDLFFSQPEPSQPDDATTAPDAASETEPQPNQGAQSPGGGQPQDLGALARILLSQDTSELLAAMANAASAANLSDIRFFTQRGIFQSRLLEQMGIQRLNDDLE